MSCKHFICVGFLQNAFSCEQDSNCDKIGSVVHSGEIVCRNKVGKKPLMVFSVFLPVFWKKSTF